MSVKAALLPWTPWIAVVAAAGIVGGGVGISGLLGHETQTVVEIGALTTARTTAGYSCPGGAPVAELDRGARVLALGRNDDASWVSVRDPRSTASIVWVPAAMIVVDADQGAIEELPLGDPCPAISLPPLEVVDAPVEPDAPAPGPAPAPAPAGDTSVPTLSSPSASPTVFYNAGATQLQVSASDNVGVTSVTATFSGAYSGSRSLVYSGGAWKLSFSIAEDDFYGDITVTFRAADAAGNQSATTSVAIDHQYFG